MPCWILIGFDITYINIYPDELDHELDHCVVEPADVVVVDAGNVV